jgi:mevalonate kinase
VSESGVAGGALPMSVRSPGKFIVFGEHAVVHGAPELLVAIDLHLQVGVASAPEFRLNREPAARSANPYLRGALDRFWPGGAPVAITTSSRIPRAAGLGSSAAFVAALGAAFGSASGGIARDALAQSSFEVERGAQGVGSPGDTSAVVAGGCVALNSPAGTLLWETTAGATSWTARRLPDPGWVWVVAYSGIPRSTAEAVKRVGHRLAEADGPALLQRFRDVATAGIDAWLGEDRVEVGRLMLENQRLLTEVGVSHPRLDALLSAVAPVAEGAKLTGAGCGGSIAVLPRAGREAEAVRRLARAGAVALAVRVATKGVDVVGSG